MHQWQLRRRHLLQHRVQRCVPGMQPDRQPGTCSPRKSDGHDTCTGSMTCDATGACKKANGQVCAAATECASGACVDGHCCGTASCGACQACTGGGGTCVMVANAEDPDSCSGASSCDATGACKKKPGQTCTAGTQCQTGNCADGYCCNTACNGACDACNGTTPGTCAPISGSPRSGHASCNGSCQSGVCCAAGKTNCGGTCVILHLRRQPLRQLHRPSAAAGPAPPASAAPPAKTNCGGTCVDLTSDDKHCGACSGRRLGLYSAVQPHRKTLSRKPVSFGGRKRVPNRFRLPQWQVRSLLRR